MKDKKTLIYFGIAFSIFLIFLGVALILYSFRDEVLNNKYIVEKSSEYTSKKKSLKKGEFSVTKDIDYVLEGRYKITYKIDYKQDTGNMLFADNSKITITDIYGDGFKLDTNEILINNDSIKIDNSNVVTSDYEINYDNNTFEITFSKDKIFKYKKIVLYIDLIERTINTKFVTSKEAFYTFIPHLNNSFYQKKTIQSYSIEGTGTIVLKNKQ